MASNNNNNEIRVTFKAFNSEFNKNVKSMNDEMSSLKQQMKLQQEEMKHTATESEKLTAKMNSLQQIYDAQRRKTQETEEALRKARELWGENSEEVQKYEAILRRQQIAEQQAANAITETGNALERAQQAQNDYEKSLRSMNNLLTANGKSIDDFKDVIGRDLANAIQTGTASTVQLERAFGQIVRATQSASVNIDDVRRALSALDDGASVETVRNNLQQLNTSSRTASDEVKRLQQAMRLQQEQMKLTATESEKLEAKSRSLQQIYAAMGVETQEIAEELRKAKTAYGENSNEAIKLEEQLNNNQIAQSRLANEIKETRAALDQQQASAKQLQSIFDVTGTSLDHFANVLGNDLSNAIRNGTASARELDRAFDLIARSAIDSSVNIEEVRRTLTRLDGSNIDEIRRDIERLTESIEETEVEVNRLGDAFKVLGGVIAGAGIGKAIESALHASDLNSTIDIVFNVPEESKESVRQAIADVTKYIGEEEAALEGVRRQWALNADASDEANAKIVAGAASIAKAYSQLDFVELIQEVNEISGELKVTDEEALNLVNDLMKIGFPTEQLDIIAEYGGQLKRAGYEGENLKNILASAAMVDSFNIDSLLDSLKEGRIVASEMALGLSDSFKDTIRKVTGDVKKLSDEQVSIMSDGFAKQEEAFSRSLDKQIDALSKSHNKQKQALDKQMQQQYDAVSKGYDKQVEALEKSLSKELDAATKSYDKQQRELEKALSKEVQEYERATNEKIALIDKEYTEKLKLVDEEKYNQIKAIDAQIDALNAKTDAEDKAIKQRENAEKRAELKQRINQAKTIKDRTDAQKDLRDFEEKLRLEAIRDQRNEQIDSLRTQKDTVKENFDAQRDALKSELDEKKSQIKEQSEIEKEALKERQDEQKRVFQEQKQAELTAIRDSNSEQIKALREVNSAKLTVLREEQTVRKEALNERLSDEMNAVRDSHRAELESFKLMNKQKLELAKNPPDSAATEAIFSQLEAWGQAIAAGGEQGAQAYEDMVMWLDGIEDATLRNAIGTELFSTKWEDNGENIVNTLKNVEGAAQRLGETQTTVTEQAEKMGDGNALIQYRKAVQDTQIAMTPLLEVISGVIGKISEWAAKSPGLTAAIVAIVSIVGILVGALSALSPIVLTIVSLFGGGAGLSGVMSKVGPAIANIASKVLPGLRVAFGALTGPVGIVITILTTAVPLIIKHWDSIVEFFAAIGKGILSAISSTFKNVYDFLKSILSKTWQFIKDIIGKIADKFSFRDMLTNVKTAFDKAYKLITSPVEKARDALKKIIDTIKGFFKFKFEWPELKIPKLTIKKGSLNPVKWFSEGFPEISVDWFAKGGLMTKPTIFGRNGNTLLAGGEAGPEAVLPLNERVLASIGNAIFAATGRQESAPQQTIYNFEKMLDGATLHIREEADIRKVARELFSYTKANERGGRR